MSELQDKYASVITAAQGAGIGNYRYKSRTGFFTYPVALPILQLKMQYGMLWV